MARPEPINATFHHSKAKVTLSFSDPIFVAGDNVSGKMELECKADRGLGIADIKVELFAIQGELRVGLYLLSCFLTYLTPVF